MPQIASAKKRVRVQARQTAENRLHRARSRTALKNVRELAAAGNLKEAAAQIATVQTYLDKASKTGAWHPNTAARYKARLAATLKKAGNKEAVSARVKAAPARKASAKPAAAKVKTAPAKKTTTPPAAKPAKDTPAKPAPKKT